MTRSRRVVIRAPAAVRVERGSRVELMNNGQIIMLPCFGDATDVVRQHAARHAAAAAARSFRPASWHGHVVDAPVRRVYY